MILLEEKIKEILYALNYNLAYFTEKRSNSKNLKTTHSKEVDPFQKLSQVWHYIIFTLYKNNYAFIPVD